MVIYLVDHTIPSESGLSYGESIIGRENLGKGDPQTLLTMM